MTATAVPDRPALALPETPYVGLVPYREEDAPFFFGREREQRIVTANLRAARLTLLYGPSGVGKSSLLRAGVVSSLRARAGPALAVCVFSSWRDDPLPALTKAIRAAATDAVGSEIGVPLPGAPLAETLRGWTQHVRRLLVVLDQFEDYFQYHPDEDGEGTFFAEFPRFVNDPSLRVNFLLSIREDALAKLDRFEGRIPALFGNYLRVDHLTRAGAREAIEGPVGEYNRRLAEGATPFEIEPALVDAVVEAAASGRLALAAAGNGDLAAEEASGNVETPFLQLVMERLWRATVSFGSRRLTTQTLSELGGAQQIVENHLLESLGSLDAAEQAVAADLFRFLVSRSKTKIAHSASDLAEWTRRPEPEVAAVLEDLCRGEHGRLLRAIPPPAGEDEGTRYELFHDVLAEPIVEWRRRFEHDRDRRRTIRRFAVVAGGLGVLVAAFAALGIWALVQRNDANRATQSASSVALASAADGQLAKHPDEALLLALAAMQAHATPQAHGSMFRALVAARERGVTAILHGHTGAVRAVGFASGGMLATAGEDGTVRLWDLGTRRSAGVLDAHAGEIDALAVSPDGRTVAAAGTDGKVRLWDVRTRRVTRVLRETGTVTALAFSRDGRTIASGDSGSVIHLFDVRTGRSLNSLTAGNGRVNSIAFSPNGRLVASGGDDGNVSLWDLVGGFPLPGLEGASSPVLGVAFSPDGRLLASASDDKTAIIWDVRSRAILHTLSGHTDGVESVAFTPDGRTVATAADDGTVRLWDVRTGHATAVLNGHVGPVYGVAWSPDGRTVAGAGNDGTTWLWQSSTPSVVDLPGSNHGNIKIAFSPDGGTIASAEVNRPVVGVWDTRTHLLLDTFHGSAGMYGVAYAPDGQTIASAAEDGTVRVWSLRTHRQLAAIRAVKDGSEVSKVAFSPDGHTLAASGDDGAVHLWAVPSYRPLQALDTHVSVYGLAYSPDGRLLVATGHDGRVFVWNTRTRKLAAVLRGHRGTVWGLAFSPDGQRFATSGDDGTVRVWDARTFTTLAVLTGHTSTVWWVAFSADGSILGSASQDRTARFWDAHTFEPLAVLRGGPKGDAVDDIQFSPDGRTLALAYYSKVQLWRGLFWRDTSDLEQQVCRLVVGNLAPTEWAGVAGGLPYRPSCPG
jgi:WD40 repeat protein